jgi:hypothetical protein
MNKKALLIAVTLMAVAIMAIPMVGIAQAGNGQEKLSIRFQVGKSSGAADPGRVWTSPHDTNPYAGETNVYHQRDAGWGDASTGFLIIVDEGGANEAAFDDEDITYSCSSDVNLFFSKYPDIGATIKVRETWNLGEKGYIEILAVEYLYHYGSPYYYGEGTFVGHGEIDGQKIVLSGEAGVGGGASGPFRIGAVMGWPTS